MGLFKKEPPPPPPPPPTPPPRKTLTDTPWRQPSDWKEALEQEIKEEIRSFNPQKNMNLLMLGPVGTGKSSFINSILSIGRGRKYDLAPTGNLGASSASCTLDLEWYTEKSLLKSFRLMDSTGVEPLEQNGLCADDLVALVKGHIKKGYTFNPRQRIKPDDTYYRIEPELEHQTQCVVFVATATAIHAGIPPGYTKKIAELQEKIKRERIPRILILTKVDELCEEVEKDITKLFKSVKVQEAVKVASEIFNIGPASIHPVQNYECDYNINPMTNIPVLLALRQAMQYAQDRVEHVQENIESDRPSAMVIPSV